MKSPIFTFWLPICVVFLFGYSCKDNTKGKQQKDIAQQDPKPVSTADSTLFHFWDKFDMQDTAQVKNPEKGEQRLADFIQLLSQNPDSATRDKAVDLMLDKAKVNRKSFDYFIKQYEHYLYDGNSPMRNDIMYESVLRYLIKTDKLSDLEKEAYRPTYKLVLRNKEGQIAEDFTYELANGKKQKLSDTKAKYTFLIFYDPDCSHCKETIHQLRDTPQLVQLFTQLKVQVLAIDPWGDRVKWKNYQSQLSDQWINGFDSESKILSFNLYDLKASPTIYLLDENKKVLLKDTYLQQVIAYFVKTNP
jgi:thiol-disulfide isomerase/thioredoxin